jgi:hypothetical protein
LIININVSAGLERFAERLQRFCGGEAIDVDDISQYDPFPCQAREGGEKWRRG